MADLDKAFQLIEEGNKNEEQNDYWNSAISYEKACSILNNTETNDEKVKELCSIKAKEYLQHARQALIQAMTNETEEAVLSDDEAKERNEIFAKLFSKMTTPQLSSTISSQSSLEERLARLNQSLPSHIKSAEQRIGDINRGLDRLGVSLPTHHSANAVHPSKSEDQQVEDIIRQARDEVAIGGILDSTTNDVPQGSYDDVDSDSMQDLSTDEEHDLEPRDIEAIRELVVDAQSKLAELNALLEIDEDQDAEIEFSQPAGKRLLKDAQRQLRAAATTWANC